MLARVVRRSTCSAAQQSSRLLATSSLPPAAPMAMASSEPLQAAAPLPLSASNGELAWCEIYGMDYAEQVRQAEEDSPIDLKDTRMSPTEAARRQMQTQSQSAADVWSAVFSTSH